VLLCMDVPACCAVHIKLLWSSITQLAYPCSFYVVQLNQPSISNALMPSQHFSLSQVRSAAFIIQDYDDRLDNTDYRGLEAGRRYMLPLVPIDARPRSRACCSLANPVVMLVMPTRPTAHQLISSASQPMYNYLSCCSGTLTHDILGHHAALIDYQLQQG
jgi:hypothetical protein